jgi:uroporphyrin-III C-methyltransferase/precorrin-2 dehydrogenase/sirohydrochlorin ferrochelatase
MNSLANLPVFLRLSGRRAVLAGEGEPAAWKAELLTAAGAEVALFARAPSEKLRQTAERLGLACQARSWREADFDGALIAVLEARDDAEAARFRAAARAAGALVNVIDRPRFCDFSFGSVVERSPLVIGVSTDGAAPVFAQAVRSRIEAMFPETLRDWAQAARAWRARLAGLDAPRRRAIWLDFAARAFASVDRAPTEADYQALSQETRTGRLIVVGAGPGAADLLTLRAVRALQAADHVVEDGPVREDLREFGRREASYERCAQGAGAAVRGAAIARVGEGATVVALVGGDGRETEWAADAARAGVACHVVPGVAGS